MNNIPKILIVAFAVTSFMVALGVDNLIYGDGQKGATSYTTPAPTPTPTKGGKVDTRPKDSTVYDTVDTTKGNLPCDYRNCRVICDPVGSPTPTTRETPKGGQAVLTDYAPSPSPESASNVYQGRYFSFTPPRGWTPSPATLTMGARRELVHLGAPGTYISYIGFWSPDMRASRPSQTVREQAITINGIPGRKWVLQGSNYTGYYYMIPITLTYPSNTGVRPSEDTFGIKVQVEGENPALEAQLDEMVHSIALY